MISARDEGVRKTRVNQDIVARLEESLVGVLGYTSGENAEDGACMYLNIRSNTEGLTRIVKLMTF